jgi:hypothetical protein
MNLLTPSFLQYTVTCALAIENRASIDVFIYLLREFFNMGEDGNNESMRNARQFLPHYMTSHPSRPHSILPQRHLNFHPSGI